MSGSLRGPFWRNGTYFSNMSAKSTCYQCAVGAWSLPTQTVNTQAFKLTFFLEDLVIDETRFPNKEYILIFF